MENDIINVINMFVKKYNYKTYLEVGIETHNTINQVQVEHKVGIDPSPRGAKVGEYEAIKIHSDDYFKSIDKDVMFDIVFIDGGHEKEQVKRDILNSLEHLNESGTIICHDINPASEACLGKVHCYNAWETFAEFRQTRGDLIMWALEKTDIGIIQRGKQKTWEDEIEPTWEYFSENRKKLLNEINGEEFERIFEVKL